MTPEIRPTRWMGEILLAQPLSTAWLAWVSILMAICVATGLYAIDYTRKERVTGNLVLDKGLVKIYAPPVVGVVTRRLVRDGEKVEAGQVLFVVSLERASSARGDTQAELLRQMAQRKTHLVQERDKQAKVLQRDEAALTQRLVFLSQEIALLTQEIETQNKRQSLNQTSLSRNQELVKENFVSPARMDELQQELLDQQLRMQVAQRNLTEMRKQQNQLQNDLASLPLTMQNRLSEYDRQILVLEQETTDSESRRELTVNAPQAGLLTTVLVDVGQTVTADKPLAALLPNNAKLQANLYLPSRAYGFVLKDMEVLLRYPAYPYQKFGQYAGRVSEIGRTALVGDELRAVGQVNNEPFYRVTVLLDSQWVMAYGKPIVLQDGLQVEADILIDTRKLYEWVLEPLYSVTGKL